MGPRERRDRERAETRQLILNAARELFAAEGIEAVSMRQIAKRIEYTPTTIYHHFRDKQALLTELCHDDFRALAGAFVRIGHIADPLARLQAIGMAYVDFSIAFPSHYRFMFMTRHVHLEDPDEVTWRKNPEEDAYFFLRQTVEEALYRGQLREELRDADQVAQMVWGAVHGVIALHIAKHDDPWITWAPMRETARAVIEAMTRGIARAPL